MGRNRWMAIGVALAVCVAACGGDDGGGPQSFAGEMTSVMVEAGKSAALTLGAVKLDVPEGAVAADTEVTVEVSAKSGKPEESKIAIDVYDFGPDGTTFDKAVKLEFDLKGVALKGKKAQVAWLEDGKWKTLPTMVKDGKASAETTHFTPFTVLVFPDSSQQVGGMCGDFEPCGGDPVGTWEYSGACLKLPEGFFGDPGEANPFEACNVQPLARYTIDLSGEATFGADGSFMSEQTQSISGGILITAGCLEEIAAQSGGSGVTCEQFGGVPEGRDCIIGGEEEPPTTEITTGTYTTEGSVLRVMEDGYEPDPNDPGEEFCVRGDTMTVHISDEEGLDIQFTATRKR